jgi:hypothetical protein
MTGSHEVTGSIPVSSTKSDKDFAKRPSGEGVSRLGCVLFRVTGALACADRSEFEHVARWRYGLSEGAILG